MATRRTPTRTVGLRAAALAALALSAATPAAAQETIPASALLAPRHLLTVGWIVDRERYEDGPAVVGAERDGPIEDRSLTTFDRVLVPASIDGRPLVPGELLVTFRLPRAIVDPDTDEPIGWLLEPTGAVRVDSFAGEVARAVVVDAFSPIEVGDYVRRVSTGDTVPEIGHGAALARGRVVAFQYPQAIHPPYDRLFLRLEDGRGGVGAGDVVELYRSGGSRDGLDLPDVVLGRAMILRVSGDLAAAVLIELERGDLVEGDRFRPVGGGG